MLTIWVVANALIALAYFGIGLYLAPRLEIGSGRIQTAIRLSAITFFVLCALTHVELALHVNEYSWWLEDAWHTFPIHVIQGPAGLAFLFLARSFVGIRVVREEPQKEALRSSLRRWMKTGNFAADVLLFVLGVVGIVFSALAGIQHPVLLLLFGVLIGMPLVRWGLSSTEER